MSADLFGLELQEPRRNDRPEAVALLEVLKAPRAHPLVAWANRANSGAAKVDNRLDPFRLDRVPGLAGASAGRLRGVAAKGPADRVRLEQAVFIEQIRASGGAAFPARNWAWAWRRNLRGRAS